MAGRLKSRSVAGCHKHRKICRQRELHASASDTAALLCSASGGGSMPATPLWALCAGSRITLTDCLRLLRPPGASALHGLAGSPREMLEVRSEIIEFSSTPTAPWMLQLETLQSLRGALQELLTVSTFDEQGRSEPGVEKVAMCRGIVPGGRPLLAAAAACLPAASQCFPFTCGTLGWPPRRFCDAPGHQRRTGYHGGANQGLQAWLCCQGRLRVGYAAFTCHWEWTVVPTPMRGWVL